METSEEEGGRAGRGVSRRPESRRSAGRQEGRRGGGRQEKPRAGGRARIAASSASSEKGKGAVARGVIGTATGMIKGRGAAAKGVIGARPIRAAGPKGAIGQGKAAVSAGRQEKGASASHSGAAKAQESPASDDEWSEQSEDRGVTRHQADEGGRRSGRSGARRDGRKAKPRAEGRRGSGRLEMGGEARPRRGRRRRIAVALNALLRHLAVREGLPVRSDGFISVEKTLNSTPLTRLSVCRSELLEAASDETHFQLRGIDGALHVRATCGHSLECIDQSLLPSSSVGRAKGGSGAASSGGRVKGGGRAAVEGRASGGGPAVGGRARGVIGAAAGGRARVPLRPTHPPRSTTGEDELLERVQSIQEKLDSLKRPRSAVGPLSGRPTSAASVEVRRRVERIEPHQPRRDPAKKVPKKAPKKEASKNAVTRLAEVPTRRLKPTDALPAVCVHGTKRLNLSSILQEGLRGEGREPVRCVPFEPGDVPGAFDGCEVAVYLNLKRALQGDVPFFRRDDVLLSPSVISSDYILKVQDLATRQWLSPLVARFRGSASRRSRSCALHQSASRRPPRRRSSSRPSRRPPRR